MRNRAVGQSWQVVENKNAIYVSGSSARCLCCHFSSPSELLCLFVSAFYIHNSYMTRLILLNSFRNTMRRRKAPSQILRSYKNLLKRVHDEDAFLVGFPDSITPTPHGDVETIDHSSLEALESLRDLLHLKTELLTYRSRIPAVQVLTFVASPDHVRSNPYERTVYDHLTETNRGDTALTLKDPKNRNFIQFEQSVFQVLHSLKQIPRFTSIQSHSRFHSSLIAQALALLESLDLIKSEEWRRQADRYSHPTDQYVVQNGKGIYWASMDSS